MDFLAFIEYYAPPGVLMAAVLFLWRSVETLKRNHLSHLQKDVDELKTDMGELKTDVAVLLDRSDRGNHYSSP